LSYVFFSGNPYNMSDSVECRSDSTYAEKPVALAWDGLRLEITDILSRWRGPDKICFRVRVSEGRIFELTYHEAADRWHIQSL
jgi:hypothetical protein